MPNNFRPMPRSILFVMLAFILLTSSAVIFFATPEERIQSSPTVAIASQVLNPDVNFDGAWTMKDGTAEFNMEAEIKDGAISIEFVNDSTHFLYWSGSFKSSGKEGDTITSVANKIHLDGSIMGSSSDTKTFIYKDGKFSYELTISGATRTITLVRK